MNKQPGSESSQTQRNMSKGAPSQVAAGAVAQRSQSALPNGPSQGSQEPERSPSVSDDDVSFGEEMVDPVCGMVVDASDESAERLERKGTIVYFCSAECREQYEAAPEDFR